MPEVRAIRLTAATALRAAAISVVYLVAWLGLNELATSYTGTSGDVSPWYLSAALTFYLLYTCGLRYIALPLVAELLLGVVHPAGWHLSVVLLLEFGLVVAGGYALAARIACDTLRINIPFVGARDALYYGALAVVAPLLIGTAAVAVLAFGGAIPWNHYFDRVLTFWVGDSVGLFVLVPVLATYLSPVLAPWVVSPEALDDEVPVGIVERVALYATLVVALVLGYAAVGAGISKHPILYFTFVPLMWLAARGGLRVAIPAIVCADVTMIVVNILAPARGIDALELQSYVVVSAITALAIGALVNDQHRTERQVRLLGLRDSLTGLANRLSLQSWVSHASTPLTLVTIDIDRMKLANDGLSREDGDELLRHVAERLLFLDSPFVAHIAADQFACAFAGDDAAVDCVRKAAALFDDPFALPEGEVFIDATMGVAVAHKPEELNVLLRRADIAMYRAKRAGHGGFAAYTAEMEMAEAKRSLASELHRALRDKEFVLYYQPLFRVEDGRHTFVGAEALLRWNHPELGILEPAAFLDLLESLALAERVGVWIVDEACRQLRAWLDGGLDLSIWVNLFPRQAVEPGFAADVTKALLDHKIAPARLVLEIVERVYAEDEREIGNAIRGLRSLGVQLAIDDFGTGHSSLARLRESPAHIIKIDGSFVARSEMDPRARGVIHAVLQIAEELRLTPLAEGIENEAQLRLVTSQGCKLVQGYYLARPMPASQIEATYLAGSAATKLPR